MITILPFRCAICPIRHRLFLFGLILQDMYLHKNWWLQTTDAQRKAFICQTRKPSQGGMQRSFQNGGLPATDLRDEREDAAAHCLAASGQVFCVQMALFELRQRGWWHTASWSVSCLSHLPTEHFLLPNQTNFAPSNLSNITGTLQLFLPALHPRCSCELRHGDRPRFQVLQPHLQHLLHSGCIFHYI